MDFNSFIFQDIKSQTRYFVGILLSILELNVLKMVLGISNTNYFNAQCFQTIGFRKTFNTRCVSSSYFKKKDLKV
jgi:hypothetical protein